MILRRAAPGFRKPVLDLKILVLIVVSTIALTSLLAFAAPMPGAEAKGIDTAKSLADGDVLTATTKLAQNLPDGRVYDKVYGRPSAVGLQDAGAEAPKPRVTGVTQPQAASFEVFGAVSSIPNGQKRQIGMFVLLLITLSAVTLLMWPHYRRDYASPRRIGRRI
jgi:hypothetical protein